jgi:DDB1- and CUL4-associated factor 12
VNHLNQVVSTIFRVHYATSRVLLIVNPSGTLVATGSGDNSMITIYRLPDFKPMALLKGHTDIVFSISWITDDCLVSGSRDTQVAFWKLSKPHLLSATVVHDCDILRVFAPISIHKDHQNKVRCLRYNAHTDHTVTLSNDAVVKLWDTRSRVVTQSIILERACESVCIGMNEEYGLYSIGSQSDIHLIDPRVPKSHVHAFVSLDENFGVRSLVWNDSILTIGGGLGRLSFYDARNMKYIEMPNDIKKPTENTCYRKTGEGWTVSLFAY